MTTNAPATQDIPKSKALMMAGTPKTIMDAIMERRQSLEAVANRHLKPDKLIKLVGAAISRNPKLAQCTPMSWLLFCQFSAETGLPPTLGRLHPVPFKNNRAGGVMEVVPIVGYGGLCDLMRRSGEVGAINCDVVREGDLFEFTSGTNITIKHTKKAPLSAKLTHAYAVIEIKGSNPQVTVMTAEEVLRIKHSSKGAYYDGKPKADSPWHTHEDEMWKKTALRRGAKYAPMAVEDMRHLEQSEQSEFDMDKLSNIVGDAAATVLDADDAADSMTRELQGMTDTKPEDVKPEPEKKAKGKAKDETKSEPAKTLTLKERQEAAKEKFRCAKGKDGCAVDGRIIEHIGFLCSTHDPENPANQ